MVLGSLLGFELPPLMLVAIALVVILVLRSWANRPANLPPMPVRPWPVIGHLPLMGHDPRGKMMEWSKQTGEIFSLYFGPKLVIVLSSYDVLKDALVKQADLFTAKPKGGFLPAIGVEEGIIVTSGPVWKENRSTVLSILRSFGMGKNIMAEKVTEEVNCYMAEISLLKAKPANVKDLTQRAVSNVICNCLLGKRFDYKDKYYTRMLGIFDYGTEITGASTLQMWFPWVKYLPGDLFRVQKTIDNDNYTLKFADEFIRKTHDDSVDGINKDNIIASYIRDMNAKEEKGQPTHLSRRQLQRVINDLLTAGSETVTSTILWFYLYLLHHPDVQTKVHEEIDHKIGQGRAPLISDRPNLPYVCAAIMETQRIASIVPLGLFHRCTEETTVRGYTIPKDTHIMPHLDSVLLSEKIWGDPENFRPERFINEKGNLLNPEQFVPFSMGRRLCLGEALARAELFLFITHVFQGYRVQARDPSSLPPLDSHMGLTRAPKPYDVAFVPREV